MSATTDIVPAIPRIYSIADAIMSGISAIVIFHCLSLSVLMPRIFSSGLEEIVPVGEEELLVVFETIEYSLPLASL
jgi:hypothetical protein